MYNVFFKANGYWQTHFESGENFDFNATEALRIGRRLRNEGFEVAIEESMPDDESESESSCVSTDPLNTEIYLGLK